MHRADPPDPKTDGPDPIEAVLVDENDGYGYEPGLRFAAILGRGRSRCLTWGQLDRWKPEDGLLWLHLERDHPMAKHWLRTNSGIDPVLVESLIDDESRPRIDVFGDALVLVLRGISRVPKDRNSDFGHGVDLVPVHVWIDGQRVISLRDATHSLKALRDLRNAAFAGTGPTRSGELLVGIAGKIVHDLEPVLDEMDDEVDELEETLLDAPSARFRRALAELRRRAIHLRRYLTPQRDALLRLQHEEPTWLLARDRIYLREILDTVQRYIEHLDAIRDRATIVHEDLNALITERVARTSNRLAALAAILLPPSLVAALFGMNLGGIPGERAPFGFIFACAGIVLLTLVILVVLRRAKWL